MSISYLGLLFSFTKPAQGKLYGLSHFEARHSIQECLIGFYEPVG